MALDGLTIYGIICELNTTLKGGKIDKITQPEKDEVLLAIRNEGKTYKLLISASSSNPRVYLTESYKKENPLKEGDEVIVSSVSWSTTYMPLQQYNLNTLNTNCSSSSTLFSGH